MSFNWWSSGRGHGCSGCDSCDDECESKPCDKPAEERCDKCAEEYGGECRHCGCYDKYPERGKDGKVCCWQCVDKEKKAEDKEPEPAPEPSPQNDQYCYYSATLGGFVTVTFSSIQV